MSSRRDFLIKTMGGVAVAGLLGKSGLKLNAQEAKNTQPRKGTGAAAQPLIRILGRTGIKIPVVSMGVMNADNPALVKRAFELGIRHFDTAAGYQKGRNEEMVGQVLKELKAREQTIIATKIIPPPLQVMTQMGDEAVKKDFLERLDGSLRRLQSDYVDILYVHGVKDLALLRHAGLNSALESAKNQKKARFIGFSTHSNMQACLEEAARSGFFEVILTSINYSMFAYQELLDSMKKAAGAGIGLVAMKTQCQQPWYREDEPQASQNFYDGPILHTALLKWVLRLESITTVVPGYQTFQELDLDWPVAFNLEYNPEEIKFLSDRRVRLAMQRVCQQCYRCTSTCPRGVDIPALLRAHMYAASYANFQQAKQTLTEIPAANGLQACVDCGACQAQCSRRVQISRRLQELKTIFA